MMDDERSCASGQKMEMISSSIRKISRANNYVGT